MQQSMWEISLLGQRKPTCVLNVQLAILRSFDINSFKAAFERVRCYCLPKLEHDFRD